MDTSFSPCNSTAYFHQSSFGLQPHNNTINNPYLYKEQKKNHGDGVGAKKKPSSSGKAVKLSTDRQSVAARERRHRISDRFKILQSLVPGGAKMDTVSMLEGAIHYVNFLKAQIWLHETMINSVAGDHYHNNCVPSNDSSLLIGSSDYYYDPSSDCSQFLGDAAIHDDEWLQADAGFAPPYPPSQLAFVEGQAPLQAEETMYYDESMYY